MNQELELSAEAAGCSVEVNPAEADAGAEIVIRATAPAEMAGQALIILSATGEQVGELAFTAPDGEASRTEDLALAAPSVVGTHAWQAVLEDGSTIPFEVSVRTHRPNILVWGVPQTVAPEETFRIKTGVKCASGCSSVGWPVTVEDHTGATVAEAAASETTAPGTVGLHSIEVELKAPAEIGRHVWRARIAPSGELPHEERSATFRVRVAPAPDLLLHVEAWDADAGAPLPRAKVVVHPYRTVTNDDGVAKLRLPKGEYNLFVSGPKHIPFRHRLAVSEDMTIRADLHIDLGVTEADIWA